MNNNNIFGFTVKSLYRYPELRAFLAKEDRENESVLKSLNFLSRFYKKVCYFNGVTLIMAVEVYILCAISVVVGINLLNFNIDPFFVLYLFLLTTGVTAGGFLLRLFLKLKLQKKVQLLSNDFEVINFQEYVSDYVKENDVYFNMRSSDFKRIAQKDLKAVVRIDRALFNESYSGNGVLAEIRSKHSQRKMYLQLKAI